jgi:hypothetical protein
MVNSNNNSPGFANEIINEQEQYGELVWPRFYGPSAYYKYVRTFVLGSIILIILFATTLMFDPLPYMKFIGVGFIGIIIIYGFWAYYKIQSWKRLYPEYSSLSMAGDLDYDIYENGIIVKEYSKEKPSRILTKFIPFSNISKAYIFMNKKNTDIIFGMTVINKPVLDDQQSKKQRLENKHIKKNISHKVWLIVNGKPVYLRKDHFNDLHKFKQIMLSRIGNVE